MAILFIRCLLLPALVFCLLSSAAEARGLTIIRDAEIETTIRNYAAPLFEAAALDPEAVEVLIVQSPTLNAFVAGGQKIFVHTGLLLAADNPNQLIGVIAHETGHISGGHLARMHEALRNASAQSILALILGGVAAVAGQGDLAAAVIAGGATATQQQFFHYTRVQEGAADLAALRFLDATGQSSRGLMVFLDKLGDQELLIAASQDPYARTHPLSRARVETIEAHVKTSRYSDAPDKPAHIVMHTRMKAKLQGYVTGLVQTLRKYPESDTSLPARYARAVAYHGARKTEKALEITQSLIDEAPNDPYFYELKGQILIESYKVDEAIPPYARAVELDGDSALLRIGLGHAQVSTESDAHVKDAIKNLKIASQLEPRSPSAWRWLAMAYGRDGQIAMAALSTAERYALLGRYRDVAIQANRALRDLPASSPMHLRAQDLDRLAKYKLKKQKQ